MIFFRFWWRYSQVWALPQITDVTRKAIIHILRFQLPKFHPSPSPENDGWIRQWDNTCGDWWGGSPSVGFYVFIGRQNNQMCAFRYITLWLSEMLFAIVIFLVYLPTSDSWPSFTTYEEDLTGNLWWRNNDKTGITWRIASYIIWAFYEEEGDALFGSRHRLSRWSGILGDCAEHLSEKVRNCQPQSRPSGAVSAIVLRWRTGLAGTSQTPHHDASKRQTGMVRRMENVATQPSIYGAPRIARRSSRGASLLRSDRVAATVERYRCCFIWRCWETLSDSGGLETSSDNSGCFGAQSDSRRPRISRDDSEMF